MNSKIKTYRSFKFAALLLFTIAICNCVMGQTRPPQNIRRVTVTNQYVLEDGNKTGKYWAIYQEMFDSLGRKHTEIAYDFTDHYPHNYYWHTFNGKLKVKTESFKDQKLQTIEEYNYNSDSLLFKKTIKKVDPNDTSIFLIVNYKYDLKGNPVEISAKTTTGKNAYISKSTYNTMGKELTRKVKVKKNFSPQDSILKLLSIPIYDSIGRLKSEQLTINKLDKTVIHTSYKYSYDKSNKLIGVIKYDDKGKQVQREEMEYNFSRNRLSMTKFYDRNNALIKIIGKRFEIYRTNDSRAMEIDY